MNDQFKPTFPGRKMSKQEIINYLENHNELIILTTYAMCSLFELKTTPHIKVQKVIYEAGSKGDFNEYFVIWK